MCNCSERFHEPKCQHYTSCYPSGSSDYCGGCDLCLSLQAEYYSEKSKEPVRNKPSQLISTLMKKGDTVVYLEERLIVEEIHPDFIYFYSAEPKPKSAGVSRLARDVAEFLYRSQRNGK